MSGRGRAPGEDGTTQAVVRILRRDFLSPGSELDPDASLFDSGVIDSMGLIRLLARIESELGVAIPMSEILIDNFDSVNKIAAAVRKRKPRG